MGRHFHLPTAHCKRCGESWHPTVPNPIKCRHCGSPYWNIDYKKNHKPLNIPKLQESVPGQGITQDSKDKGFLTHPGDNEIQEL